MKTGIQINQPFNYIYSLFMTNNIFVRAVKWWLRLLLPDSIESPTLQDKNYRPEDYKDELKEMKKNSEK
jgi:hypothetical protein